MATPEKLAQLEERIRRRAHDIWESEGRPQGKHAEHWERARREIVGPPPGHSTLAGDSAETDHEPPYFTVDDLDAEHAGGTGGLAPWRAKP
ncbi:MAG: DUF2934 domain-containing protein [Alphaproteobacteria bacterium]|nr:DUF2934 domain-containing protein [Alphaproteobacteria bacterium]